MPRFRESIGRRVVARDTATEIGHVTRILVNRAAQITGFTMGPTAIAPVVLPSTFTGDPMTLAQAALPAVMVLDWSAVVGFGPDAVVAASAADLRESTAADSGAIGDPGLLDQPLMTAAGDLVGTIADVEFDAGTGQIAAFVVGDRAVPLTRLIAVGPFAVIVANHVAAPRSQA